MRLLWGLLCFNLWLQQSPSDLPEPNDFKSKTQLSNAATQPLKGNWTRYRGQNDNAGLAPDIKIEGKLRWSFKTRGEVFASPIMDAKGVVYIACGQFNLGEGVAPGSLYALDGKTGTKIWEKVFDDGIGCTPTLDADGILFFGSNDGRVYAVESETGTLKWKARIAERYAYSSPVVVGDTLYVLGHSLYALNTKTGKVKWTFAEAMGTSNPAFWNGRVFVASEGGDQTFCVDASTGKKLWSVKTGGASFSAVAISPKGLAVIGTKSGIVTVIDAKSGSIRWFRRQKGWIRTTAALDSSGAIYIGTLEGELLALNSLNGNTLWKWKAPAEIFSSPTLTPSGRLYFGCIDGKIYAFDTKLKDKIWEFQTGSAIYSSPLLTPTGLLIFGSNDGNVYALE